MKTFIKLSTKKKRQILIELLDNDFVKLYTERLIKTKSMYYMWQYLEFGPRFIKTWDAVKIEQIVDQIRQSINELNRMGLNFPVASDDVTLTGDNKDRNLLNQLHRYFTTGHRSVSHSEPITTWLDGSELTFDLDPALYPVFSKCIHTINDCVHQAEPFYLLQREREFKTPYREYHVLFDTNRLINQEHDPQDTYFIDLQDSHYQYFSDDVSYDVWLPSGQIQGKNYWRAFFDDDDPHQWDISLNTTYSGSFSLGQRPQAKDADFIAWLQSYGIQPSPLHVGMPLGRIVSGGDAVNWLGLTDSIKFIEVQKGQFH